MFEAINMSPGDIRVGDIITGIGGEAVKTEADIYRILEKVTHAAMSFNIANRVLSLILET